MSKKVPEEIDLNCDAVPVDRVSDDNDLNVGEPASGAASSLTGTVTRRIVDGEARDFWEDNESAAGVAELGKESKFESVKNQGIDLEADAGSLGEEVGDKVSTGLSLRVTSLMEVDGRSRGSGDGESVFMQDKKPMETEEMGVRSSGGVAEDLNVSFCANEDSLIEGTSVRSSSIADNTIPSDIACDSGCGDRKLLSSALGPENSLPCVAQNVSSKEESYGRLESRDMEIDTPDDTGKNQISAFLGEGDRFLQNAGNRSSLLNDAVDLNQCKSTDKHVSLDVNARPKRPEEPDFYVSDLVWGKVRSHPWWPGQIFDSSAATAKAKKYFKKDCYLIAYYGDHTFAWNEASWIKPFRPHFSNMEKQNNMEEFHYAVDCALDEVSRRVEFGLACSCISKEAYAQIKTQIIVNAGIREESSRRDGGDRYSSAASFDPFELVETMKTLAQSPSYRKVDRLQLITSQSQLLAFHRWKGYSKLPEFQNLCGLETDAEIPLSDEVKKCKPIGNDVPHIKVDKKVLSDKEKPESQCGSSHKRKKTPAVSGKKEKSLLELIAERRLSLQNGNGKKKSNNKASDNLFSSPPAKKLKSVDSMCDDSTVKQEKVNMSKGSIDKSLPPKQTFRVGASILRVASQLNGPTVSTPVLKHDDGTSQMSAVNKSKRKSSPGKSPGEKFFQEGLSSPEEMLSKLCLAATDPLKGYNFLACIIFFFTELRNLIAMDLNISEASEQSEQSLERVTDVLTGEKPTWFTGKSELTSVKDSCCSERIIQCLPEEQLAVEKHNQTTEINTLSEKGFTTVESQSAVEPSPDMDSEQKHTVSDENIRMEAEKRIAYSDESCTEDLSPTALILNFSDLESVPSVEDLSKIFSRYGPLVSPGAEVLKKSIRAKVIFKRRADAETAFSSSGKYSIFGPSLVSYRLKRLASAPAKASQSATKRSRVGETCRDENST